MKEGKFGLAGTIAQAFVRSKITPLLVAASLLLGIFATVKLPREEEPQISVPMFDIFVPFPGASAPEVEERLAALGQRKLMEIPGVEYVYTTSESNAALFIVRFKVGMNADEAMAASDNGDRTLLIPWAREHDWSKSAGNYVLLGADGRTLWTAAPDKYMNDKPSGPDDYYTETPSGEISGVYIFAGNKLLDRFGKPIWVLPKNEFFSGVSKEFAAVSHFDKTTSCLKIFDMRTRKVLWQTRPENYEMPLDFGGSSVQFHNGVMIATKPSSSIAP